MPKLTTEEVAEIREAITIISLIAYKCGINSNQDVIARLKIIEKQVKRIDKLLPEEKN